MMTKSILNIKKYTYTILLSAITLGCSSSDGGTEQPDPEPTPVNKPIAVDDEVTGIENEELIISSLLENDSRIGATITSFDATSTGGATIIENRDGTYTYIPKADFIGVDTFTYTICDTEETPNCSTATVTVSIVDEGDPVAIDDAYATVENTATTITTALDNDTIIDDAILTSVDGSGSSGTVELKSNGEIVYTPQSNFTGNDSFTYTICDNDKPYATCSTATITITIAEKLSLNIPAELQEYYSNVAFSNNAEVTLNALKEHTTNKHTTILSYGQRHNYLYNADEDETIADNVILMYSGESRDHREYQSGSNSHSPQTFNTEHIFPQSKLGSNIAVSDLHHLRSCDAIVNEDRSNFAYTNGSGEYKLIDSNKWYPGDDWRGDVARMVLYLNIRYNEDITQVGTMDLFLEWNAADPVSSFEIQRNNVIEEAQGNRNPFIDNPYLATIVWGGNEAENKWE